MFGPGSSKTHQVTSGNIELADALLAVLSPNTPKETIDLLLEVRRFIHDEILKQVQAALAKSGKPDSPTRVNVVVVDKTDLNTKVHYDLVAEKLLVLVKQNRAKEVGPSTYIKI